MLRTSEDEESGYEISRTYALKQIKEIKVPIAKERHERDGAKLRPLDLHIAGQPQQSTGASASAPYRASLRQDESTIIELGFEGEGEGKQMMVLALISELLKQEGGLKVPKMVGIGQEEVDKWWVSHREDALGALGENRLCEWVHLHTFRPPPLTSLSIHLAYFATTFFLLILHDPLCSHYFSNLTYTHFPLLRSLCGRGGGLCIQR